MSLHDLGNGRRSDRLDVTVAICTRNRCESLRRTLTSILNNEIPAGMRWEVLVVNNNSTDQTDAVIDEFKGRLPLVKVMERSPGKSNACNTAARLATGKYIIWTDDDVVVSAGWLNAYIEAFRLWSDAALFGGPIYARFEGPLPKWLERGLKSVEGPYVALDLGPEPVPLSCAAGMVPFGANFAIRREEQTRLLYDPRLGPGPNARYVAEETTLMRTLLQQGAKGWWVPAATVEHYNSQERMNLRYLRHFFEKAGRTQWIQRFPQQEKLFLGRPRWLWRKLLEAEARYWRARAFGTPEDWLNQLRERSTAWGTFKEAAMPSGHAPERR
jgi:glycosyltransferase involved in cell wall biosynthesis